MGGERVDFFVSHASADRAWAEWAAWQLQDAGYTVELDVWDWAAGRNFVTAMNQALARADRVVALFSSAYFEPERYTTEEWAASLLVLLEARPWRIYPGYGWLFPPRTGRPTWASGVGMGGHRYSVPLRDDLTRFCALLRERGDLGHAAGHGPVIGGWLRMGGTGTPPASGNVLLVGTRPA